jgi:hypothetical protein
MAGSDKDRGRSRRPGAEDQRWSSVAKIMGTPGANDTRVARQFGQVSTPGCLRRRCQVDVDAARAAAGTTHGEGAEREGMCIV